MTKNTSQKIALLKKVAIVPILAGLIYFFCIEIVAQEKVISEISEEIKSEITDKDKIRDSYYSNVRIILKDLRTNHSINKMYEDLSLDEKRNYLSWVPDIIIEKEVPEQLFEKMKTKNMAVWINGKASSKEEIQKHKRTDFNYYTYSFVHKNARTKRFPQEYQYTLYTKKYFDENLKNSHLHFSNDTLKMVISEPEKEWKKVNKILSPKIEADTVLWYTKEKDVYNLNINDKIDPETTVLFRNKKGAIVLKKKYKELTEEQKKLIPPSPPKKSKSGEVAKPKDEIIIEISDTEIKKIYAALDNKDLKIRPATAEEIEKFKPIIVDKLSDFDTKGKKEGWIYMKSGTYYFKRNDDNTIDYFNRWGFKVDENGEKLLSEIKKNDLNYRNASKEEIEKANYNKDIKLLDDLDKGTKKSGYLYMNNATYFFVKNDDNIFEYYNRWGFRVNKKGEKI